MAENKCAARLEPSSRDMSELKNRFKPGYDWETICSTMLEHLMCGVAIYELCPDRVRSLYFNKKYYEMVGYTKEQYEQIQKKYPRANIMIGRGFLKKPGLAQEIQQGELVDADRIWAFEKALREAYKEIMPGIPALYKMKEVWSFMRESFPEQDRLWKKIKKSKGMADYENVIREAKG